MCISDLWRSCTGSCSRCSCGQRSGNLSPGKGSGAADGDNALQATRQSAVRSHMPSARPHGERRCHGMAWRAARPSKPFFRRTHPTAPRAAPDLPASRSHDKCLRNGLRFRPNGLGPKAQRSGLGRPSRREPLPAGRRSGRQGARLE